MGKRPATPATLGRVDERSGKFRARAELAHRQTTSGPWRNTDAEANLDLRKARGCGSREEFRACLETIKSESCNGDGAALQPDTTATGHLSGGLHPAESGEPCPTSSSQPAFPVRRRLNLKRPYPATHEATDNVSGNLHPAERRETASFPKLHANVTNDNEKVSNLIPEILPKRRRLATADASSSGDLHPDAKPALDASILEAVRKLGRKPIEVKNPQTEAERDESKLALRYRKQKKELLRSTIEEVESEYAAKHALDASILEAVRTLGRKPIEVKDPQTEAERDETKLAIRYRKKKKLLLRSTIEEVESEDACSWCENLRSAKQRMEERKLKQARIDQEDEHCYRELCRRIDLMLSDPLRDTLLEERYEKAPPSTEKKQKEAEPPKKRPSDWWMNAGIIQRPGFRFSCTAAEGKMSKHGKVSLTLMHYLLSHVLLDDIRRFLSDGTHLACRAAAGKQLYIDFFTACRDPDRQVLAPWPASEELQTGTSTFKPFHCLRHLALIEMVDKKFTDLPHDHNTLLQELATHRANEESQCRLLSEMQEKAVLRLLAYWKVDDNSFANARFLDLKEAVGEGGDPQVSKVVSELAAETSLRKMVKDLNDAFEKQGIDMTGFKPNQFAALSVYYAQFLTQVTSRTKHWLNRRYCCGLRQYVPGNEIEPKER